MLGVNGHFWLVINGLLILIFKHNEIEYSGVHEFPIIHDQTMS